MNRNVRPLRRFRRRPSRIGTRAYETLEARCLLAGDVIISEFMALNSQTLVDSEGDYEDWIELYNLSNTPVDLTGWYLTDDDDELTQWQFPSVTLGANEYLVVFASGKNVTAAEELHTNFRLSGDGEYLALIEPDGESVAHQYAPFPPQLPDIAYGVGATAVDTSRLAADGPLRVHIPTDDSLGTTWQHTEFDDAAWQQGTGGVGYNMPGWVGTDVGTAMRNISPSAYVRQHFTIDDASQIDRMRLEVQYDDGFVAYLNGEEIASRNALPSGVSPATGLVSYWSFDGTLQDQGANYQNNSGVANDELTARGGTARFAAGRVGQAVALGVQGGDATDLIGALTEDVHLPAVYTIETWVRPTDLTGDWQRLVLNWGTQQSYHLAIRNNSGFNNAVSLFHNQTNGVQPNANGGTVVLDQWQHLAAVADGQQLRVYLDGVQVGTAVYDGTIHQTVSEALGIGDSFGSASTIKFNGFMDELAIWEVPLTGDQIASHFQAGAQGYGLVPVGATTELSWNSVATTDRSAPDQTATEVIDVSSFVEFIQPGENVLSIHALNSSAGSDDFLIRTSLTTSHIAIDTTTSQYYPTPTPGEVNAAGVDELGPLVENVQHAFLPPPGVSTTNLVGDTTPLRVTIPTSDALGQDWLDPDYVLGTNGETWQAPTAGGVGYDLGSAFDPWIAKDVQASMHNQNSSAFVRAEFHLTDVSVAERLKLNVRYDDGFVAYLNGQLVAARNAPTGGLAPPSGLTTYYSFDGNTSDRASEFTNSSSTVDDDLTGATASGVLNVEYATGMRGDAVRLSRDPGSAAVLSAPDSNDLDLASSWTVEAFVRPDSANTGEFDRFATKWFPGTPSWHWSFRGANNGNDLFLNSASVIAGGGGVPVPIDEWSHVAITGDAQQQTIKAWLNGVEVASAPYVSVVNGDAPLSLGNFRVQDTAFQFSGLVDEFAIWNVALSGEQLLSHATSGNYGLTPHGGNSATIAWNAAATAERPDSAALMAEQIDLTDFVSTLRAGKNVLAIHALNLSASDEDFLIVPELVAEAGSETDQPLRITADVRPTMHNVDTVDLTYRVMFDAEHTISMHDDGTHGDAAAGDGTYTVTIPAGLLEPGEMFRYFITASDVQDVEMRAPLFLDPVNSPEYFGTVLEDPSITTELPVLHRFIENPAAAETRGGTRASIYFNGAFHDNVFIRIRGGTAVNWPKKSYKIEFNDGDHFVFRPGVPAVDEFNLNTTYTDKAYMRAILAYDTHAAAGSPAPETFAMHVRQNGEFYSLSHFVEQPDRDFLRRHGFDPDGALYKGNANPTNGLTGSATILEKKTRKDEDFSDLQDLIDGLAQFGAPLETFIFDNVDLAAQVNFMAVNVLLQNIDATDKNFYIYRDTEGDGEWQMLPWDLDLVLGPNALNTDVIVAGNDAPPANTSHPYLGTLAYPYHGRKNHLFDAIVTTPRTNEMFLRRVRTLMDELLMSADTPAEMRFYESRIDHLVELLGPDVLLDRQRWGAQAHFPGATYSLPQAAQRIKNEYLAPRRTHLFDTHSIDNTNPDDAVTILAPGAPARAFVPVDGSLATTWTSIGFDDSNWLAGSSGVGYDEDTTYRSLIGIDLRSPTYPQQSRIDRDGDGTSENDSAYVRIPFAVEDPAALDELVLRMKYDDGFIAYINGVRVASANAPAAASWNSAATGLHNDGAAVAYQDFDISSFGGPGGILVAGTNILAIHALNDDTNGRGSSSDMLVLPEIVNGTPASGAAVGIPHEQPDAPVLEFGGFEVNPVSGNQDQEFIELVNPNDFAVDVSGWQLRGGVEFTMQPGTVIPAGDSLYLSPSLRDFRARAEGPRGGMGLFVQGPYDGHLSNFGETLQLMRPDGSVAATLQTPVQPSDVQQFLRLTEIHYHPAGDSDTEFLEFMNISSGASAVPLDLTGVVISEGPSEPFVFPAGTVLLPGQAKVVVTNTSALTQAYPDVPASAIAGQFVGGLANSGERIKVDDVDGSTILDFSYSDGSQWPQAADGVGASLQLRSPATASIDQLDKPDLWRSSTEFGGSPASVGQAPRGVVIREVVSNPDRRVVPSDSIELHNTTNGPVNIGGWYLSDSSTDLLKFRIPDGTELAPGEYRTFDESDFNPTPQSPESHHFALSGSEGDDVWLVVGDGSGGVSQLVDDVHFGAIREGESWQRDELGHMHVTSRPTLGFGGGEHRVGPVVISELHYHADEPTAADLLIHTGLVQDDLDFVEIHNPTSQSVTLTGWQLRGGVDFDFPTESTLGAGGTLIITSFNPHSPENVNRAAAFRNHYQLDASVAMVGGYSGQLSNSGEVVRLERPGEPPADDPLLIPAWTEDEIVYDDRNPWPSGADGEGSSLQRRAPMVPGALPQSWHALAPTPGTVEFVIATPGDLTGDDHVDGRDIDVLYDAISTGTTADYLDLDANGTVNRDDVDHLLGTILGRRQGDINLDGNVDASDFGIWQQHAFARGGASWARGDLNGDQVTDGSDFNLWWSQRFQPAPSALPADKAIRTPRAPLALHDSVDELATIDACFAEFV